MRVKCEKCESEYEIDESRVPAEGLQIKCPRCMSTFIVTPSGAAPDTAGDFFDLNSGAEDESLELDLPESEEMPNLPPQAPVGGSTLPPPVAPSGGSTLPPPKGPVGSTLPPTAGPSLPPLGGPPSMPGLGDEAPAGSVPPPAPTPGAEGQIFDFIDHEIGGEEEAKPKKTSYRIRRKSGKVFGPFDLDTVRKMLAEHQLMGNEEASTDGRTFKPLGAIEEFATIIKELMEGPSPVAGTVQGVDDDEPLDVEVAPTGVQFADPPKQTGKKSGPGAMTFVLISIVGLVLVIGLALGFTKFGFFGYKAFTGGSGRKQASSDASSTSDSSSSTNPTVSNKSLANFFQDTFTGYIAVTRELENKLKNGEETIEDLYLLGLSYAALLRNYGANPAYVKKGREIVEKLKDEAPNSPERKKVEAALLILTNAKAALATLAPIIGPKTKDKEALYLAGWAAAYTKNWKKAAEYLDRTIVMDADFAKAYHALGDIQSLQGDFENAILFYEKALDKNPRHVNSAVELARIQIEVKRDMEAGAKTLKTALGKYKSTLAPSELAKARILRAQISMKKHEPEKVIQDLQAAVKIAPNNPDFLATLGNYYLDIGESAKAQGVFEKALTIDPKNIETLIGKARSMWKNGDIVKAKMLLNKLITQAADDPRPLYFQGRVCEDLDQFEEAEKSYKASIQKAKGFLLARVALARLYLKQKKIRASLDQLTKAAKVDPKSAIVHTGFGEVYYAQANLRLAEKEFREAIRLDPELASAHMNLANTLRDEKKHQEASKEYEMTAKISPKYPDLPLEQGYNLYLQGQYPKALDIFETAIQENPKDDRLYVRAGLAAKATNDVDAAIKYFQSANGLNNMNAEALFQLGLIYQEKKDNDKALDMFKKAVEIQKDRPEIHFHIGLSYQAIDMVRDAIDEYREAIKIDPGFTEALMRLADALSSTLQYSQAIEYYKKVARDNPDRVDALVSMADAYTAQNQYQQALKTLKKAYRKKPKFPKVAYKLARALDELDRKKQAIHYYIKATEFDRSDAMPYFYLGHAYKALNKFSKALKAFKKYLKLKPDAEDADDIKDEIYYLKQDK